MVLQGSITPPAGELICRDCGSRRPIETDDDNPFYAQTPVCCHSCGTEFFPPPNIPEVDVDERLRRKTRPHRRYLGRPEVKARNYIAEHPDAERRLVRGTLTGEHPYAWVEVGGVLFDPGYQRFYDPATWYEATGAKKHNEETWSARRPAPPPGDDSYPADWMTVDDAAQRLGVAPSVIERAINARWLNAHLVPQRKGGGWRISPYFFDRFVRLIPDLVRALSEKEARDGHRQK